VPTATTQPLRVADLETDRQSDPSPPATSGGLRAAWHEQQKRLAALRRQIAAFKRAGLELLEEIASLREQLQRHGISPVTRKAAAAKFEEQVGSEEW
jgi:hypothetical protein